MSQELYHHGIQGQKWGVRRYQNSDGSYTSLGKKRRREESGYNVSAKEVKKNMNSYDDATLQKKINRINMQNQVSKLEKQDRFYNKGLKTATGVLAAVGTITAIYKLKDNPLVKDGIKKIPKIMDQIDIAYAKKLNVY